PPPACSPSRHRLRRFASAARSCRVPANFRRTGSRIPPNCHRNRRPVESSFRSSDPFHTAGLAHPGKFVPPIPPPRERKNTGSCYHGSSEDLLRTPGCVLVVVESPHSHLPQRKKSHSPPDFPADSGAIDFRRPASCHQAQRQVL